MEAAEPVGWERLSVALRGEWGMGGAGWIGSGVSNSGGDGLGVPVTGPPSSPEVDMPGQRSPGTLARGTCRKPSSPLPLPRPQPASHLTSPSHLSLSHLLYLPPCSSPISLFHPFSQVLDISPHRPSRIAWNPAPAGWFCQVQWRHSPAGPLGWQGERFDRPEVAQGQPLTIHRAVMGPESQQRCEEPWIPGRENAICRGQCQGPGRSCGWRAALAHNCFSPAI